MDINNPLLKKGKPHNARPYDRPNQGILGKVASKVKGLFNPSWLFNVLRTTEEDTSCPTDFDEEIEESQNSNQQIELHGNKRPRLKLVGNPVRNKLITETWLQPGTSRTDFSEPWSASANFDEIRETQNSDHQIELRGNKRQRCELVDNSVNNELNSQTWLQPGTSKNLYHNVEQPTSKIARNQVELDEQPVINGDDRSENSEGSASTSGCSSLISSHKDRLNNTCLQMSDRKLQSLSGQLKAKTIFQRTRQEVTSFTDRIDRSRNSSLWSCANLSIQSPTRSPSVMQSTKPSFNFTTFSGPSKISTPSNKQASSPFYEGKTTYGGASTSRRMPFSVAPYQTQRTLRNQDNRMVNNSASSNSECMSSAAKRILLTLEKMSTPVIDAKKMPNTSHSPVDLSIYLTPPSHRKNTYTAYSMQTPKVPNKGPPIANINTIARLTTMKNIGPKRHEISMEIPFVERRNVQADKDNENFNSSKNFEFLSPDPDYNKSGGGKMKSTLNQRTHFSSKGNTEAEYAEELSLPDIPLPITNLPTIQLGKKTPFTSDPVPEIEKPLPPTEKSSFTFASPIVEQGLQNPLLTASGSKSNFGFQFSSPVPIDVESPKGGVPVKKVAEIKSTEDSNKLYSSSVNDYLKSLIEKDKSGDGVEMSREVAPGKSKKKSTSKQKKEKSEETNRTDKEANESFSAVSSVSSCSFKNSGDQVDAYNQLENLSTPEAHSTDNEKSVSGENKKELSLSSNSKLTPKNIIPSGVQDGFEKFKPKPGSWECSVCLIRNKEDDHKCVACETPNPTRVSSEGALPKGDTWQKPNDFNNKDLQTSKSAPMNNFAFTVPSNTWECDTCLVRNPMDKARCIACETLRPSKENTSSKSVPGFQFSMPGQSSPIAFKFGSATPASQGNANFKFGAPASTALATTTSSDQVDSNETLIVTSSGFKIETKDLPQKTTNFGGFILNANSTTEVTEKKDAPTTFRHPKKDNITPDVGVLSQQKSDFNTVSKFSDTTGVKLDSPVTSSIISTSESSIQNSSFLTTSANIAKKDSSETSDVISKQFQFGAPSSQAIPKISESFSTDAGKMKSQDPFGVKTIASSSVPVFGSFAAKDNKNAFALPKVVPEQKSTVGEKVEVKGSSVISEADNSFKFVAPLPVSSSKQTTPASFGLPAKTDTNMFNFAGNSKMTEAPKSAAIFTAASSFSTVSSGSATNFKFSDSSPKPLSLIPNVNDTTQPKSTFQSTVLKGSGTEVSASSSFTVPTTVATSSFTFGNPSAVTTASSVSGFSFFPSSTSSNTSTKTSGMFTFGATSTTADQQKTGGFVFKGLAEEKTNPLTSSTPSFTAFKQESAAPTSSQTSVAVSAAPTLFKFGAPTTVVDTNTGFVFGAPKTEPQSSVAAPFVFGSNAATPSASNPAFPLFQQNQSALPAAASSFQFGSNVAANPAAPPSTFGSQGSAFTFGAKSKESANQMTSAVPQNPTFGSTFSPMQPIFGGATTSTPAFGKTSEDKPQPSGFNFAPSVALSPVFRFGAQQEKKASLGASPAPGFSFGTAETPSSFPPAGSFSINTPPSFNFGAASTPGPFQFAASNENRSNPGNPAPARRYRKAVRRGNRRE